MKLPRGLRLLERGEMVSSKDFCQRDKVWSCVNYSVVGQLYNADMGMIARHTVPENKPEFRLACERWHNAVKLIDVDQRAQKPRGRDFGLDDATADKIAAEVKREWERKF